MASACVWAPAAQSGPGVSDDWPCLLGPSHNGVSRETGFVHTFPRNGPPLLWEVEKGTGYSSPAVVGGRAILFHRLGDLETVDCLDAATGRRLWRRQYPTSFEDRYGYNNGPRSSPVIDSGRVFTIGAEAVLHCLDLQTGNIVWKRDLRKDYRLQQDFFGVSSTPLIDGDRLIANLGAPGGPTVAAFRTSDGEFLWGAGKDWGASYSSPIPAVIHGQHRVFVFAGGESSPPTGGLIALNPATGAIDFSHPWRSKSYESVNASCPVIFGNRVFVSASYRTGGVMLEVQKDMSAKVLWTTQEFGLHFNTPIFVDDYLYGFDGRNEPDASLACLDANTGRIQWRTVLEWPERIMRNGEQREQTLGTYRGNLLRVENRFLALGELGHLLWLDLIPKGYRVLSRAWLFAARETWSVPVLSHGRLYVMQHARDFLHQRGPRLLCYKLRE